MSAPRADVFSARCPSRAVLEQLAGKWSLLLLHRLATGPRRPSELRRAVGGISEKMLVQTLRGLERNGFVARRNYAEVPPRVEYALTAVAIWRCAPPPPSAAGSKPITARSPRPSTPMTAPAAASLAIDRPARPA